MSDELPPIDLPRPHRKKSPSAKRLQEELDDLRQERQGLLERCHIAEQAACQNLVYAQSAREAMEDLFEKIMTRLNDLHAPTPPQNPNRPVSVHSDRSADPPGHAVRPT